VGRWSWLALALVWGCGSAPPEAELPPKVTPAPKPPGPDYVAVVPHAYLPALAPLLAYRRAQGHRTFVIETEKTYGTKPDAAALQNAIREVWTKGSLRFVLLVGDIPRDDEPVADRLPAFYLPKLEYPGSDHADRHLFHRSLLTVQDEQERFPSDYPYGVMRGEEADVLVGRLPARSAEEVSGFVRKVIDYETKPIDTPWPRRVVVHAGPARFSDVIDRIIEHTAVSLLDEEVPYDYDVDLVFGKPGSEYAPRLDRLGESLTERVNSGAFLLAYVGHSSPAYFDTVEYRGQSYSIGSRDDFERMKIEEGAPIFVSLSCDVGAFDMSKGRRSIAEEAVLNPKGSIAAFASTRESHPYPNLLYGEALIARLIHERPATIGEGIRDVKRDMLTRVNFVGEKLSGMDSDVLKREHVALYNLFGDPATRLRYPQPLQPKFVEEGPHAPGAELALRIQSQTAGRAQLTIELPRTQSRASLVPAEDIERMPLDAALQAMADNHQRAADKVLDRREMTLAAGVTTARIKAPDRPGRYVVKLFAFANGGTQAGHAFFEVK